MKKNIVRATNFTILAAYMINTTPVLAIDNMDISKDLKKEVNLNNGSDSNTNKTEYVIDKNSETNLEGSIKVTFDNEYLKNIVAESVNKNVDDVVDDDYLSITELNLKELNLSGEIPSDIGKFTNLEVLDLSSNNLNGSIPVELGNLRKLQHLNLSNNNLSGDISSNICVLNNLETLNLRNNNFNGKIPSEIGNLKKLKGLYLSNNLFEGEIPNSLYYMSNLRWLDLGENLLEYIVFSHLSNLTELEELHLNNNKFTGSINANYSNLKKLKVLDLRENNFNGDIPMDISNVTSLTKLDLSNNDFSGYLDNVLDGLEKLNYLNVSNNKLIGTIPIEIYTIGTLDTVKIQNNQFISLPEGATNKYDVDPGFYDGNIIEGKNNQKQLKINEIFDVIVEESMTACLGEHVDKVVLEKSDGESEELSELYTLKFVDVSDNSILSEDDNVANQIGAVTAKIAIYVAEDSNTKAKTAENVNINVIARDNWLNNAFAEQLGKTREELTLDDYLSTEILTINNYTDAEGNDIPDDISKFTNLKELNLSNNKLKGSINGMIGLLSSLEKLNLSHNEFVYAIPEVICGLPNLKELNLTYNQLSSIDGTLSSEFLNNESIGYNLLDVDEAPLQKQLWIPEGLVDEVKMGEWYVPDASITEAIKLDVNGTKEELSYFYSCEAVLDNEYFDESNMPKKVGSTNLPIRIQGLDGNRTAITENTYTVNISNSDSVVEQCEIIVEYIDADTLKPLLDTVSIYANVGETIEIPSQTIENYTVVGDEVQRIDVQNADNPITVTFRYKKNNVADNWLNRAVAKECNKEYTELTDSDYHSITRLDLTEEPVSGTIPTDIVKLINLEELILKGSYLTGNIPKYIDSLTNLKVLDLEGNLLEGSLPNELFEMDSLEVLNLKNNQFTDTLNSSLGNLVNLKELNLSYNQFTGSIPAEIGALQNLEELKLDNNEFSGVLPSELYNLTSIIELRLYNNSFSGTIDANINKLSNLRILDLENNSFSGVLPDSIGDLSKLEYVWLNNNEFTGEIPASINKLSNLVSLRIQENNFTGNIFTKVNSLSKLTQLIANNNNFSGEISDDIAKLESLVELRINNNEYRGSIPDSLFNLTNINNINLKENHFIKISDNIPDKFNKASVLSGNILEDKEEQYQLMLSEEIEMMVEVNETLDLSNIRSKLIMVLGSSTKNVNEKYNLSFEAEKEYFSEEGKAIKPGETEVFIKIREADVSNKKAITSTGIKVTIVEKEPEVKGSVVVTYVDDKTGNSIATEVRNVDLTLGEYTYNAKNVDGYSVIGDSSKTVTLTKDNPNQTVEFRYEKVETPNETPVEVKGSVTITYVDDKTGNSIATEVRNTDLALGEYTYNAKKIDGYNIVGDSSKTVALTKDNPNKTVEFRYEKVETPSETPVEVKGSVTIKHRDLNTGELIKNIDVQDNLILDTYRYTAENFEGYIVYGDNSVTVTLDETKNVAIIEFKYIKSNGENTISLSRIKTFVDRDEPMIVYGKDVQLTLSPDTLKSILNSQNEDLSITLKLLDVSSRAISNESIANLHIESNIDSEELTKQDYIEVSVNEKYNNKAVGIYKIIENKEDELLSETIARDGQAVFKIQLADGEYTIKTIEDTKEDSNEIIPDTSGAGVLMMFSSMMSSLAGTFIIKRKKNR